MDRRTFPVGCKTYWEQLWLHVPFLERLYTEQLGFRKVELLSQEGDLERGFTRVLRMHKVLQAPAVVQKVLGEIMVLDQYSEFDPETNVWRYRVVPERMADRTKVRGSITVKAAAQGVEEISEGEMEFAMFGVGGVVEAFMVREEQQVQALRSAFMLKYISEQGLV